MDNYETSPITQDRHSIVKGIAGDIFSSISKPFDTKYLSNHPSPDNHFLFTYNPLNSKLFVSDTPQKKSLLPFSSKNITSFSIGVTQEGDTTIIADQVFLQQSGLAIKYAEKPIDTYGRYILTRDTPIEDLDPELFNFVSKQLTKVKHSFLYKNN